MTSRPVSSLKLPLEASGLDMRDAFFDEVIDLAAKNPNLLLLTDDQGAFALEWMRENLPAQYFNVGIAEQNLISVAAGLALGGKKIIAYGIAAFMTMRCYEQIRDDLCVMDLPVTIVVSGSGYTYAGDGPTHHAVQDLALMRSIPSMTIYNPSDATSTSLFARMAFEEPGPKYVRIDRGTLGKIYNQGDDFSAGFNLLVDGSDLIILSTGIMVHTALRAVEELGRRGVNAGVIDVYRLKPVDGPGLLAAIGDVPRIVTLEEHSIVGGLSSLTSEILADNDSSLRLLRLALPDTFVFKYGTREWLQAEGSIDLDSVVSRIVNWTS